MPPPRTPWLLEHVVPPKHPPGFPGVQRSVPKTPQPGGGLRMRWKDGMGRIYEWDYQHGTVEVYDSRGRHLGEFDPDSGERVGPADSTRTVEP